MLSLCLCLPREPASFLASGTVIQACVLSTVDSSRARLVTLLSEQLGASGQRNCLMAPTCCPHKLGLSWALPLGPLCPWVHRAPDHCILDHRTPSLSFLPPTLVNTIPACLAAGSAWVIPAETRLLASTFAALIRLISTSSKTLFLIFISGMI